MRNDALEIWRAGFESVKGDALIRKSVAITHHGIAICGEKIDLNTVRRIVIVGAGKAVTPMAEQLVSILKDTDAFQKDRLKITGWINVPDNTVDPIKHLTVHPARPAGLNEPTQAAVNGTNEILKLVGSCMDEDIVICLISGGGSALLPCPIDEITLDQKTEITRLLSLRGANIAELNTVRKELSKVKGGKLAANFRGKNFWTLILSDVIGDPLDVIASGPTVPNSTGPIDAIKILQRYAAKSRRNRKEFRKVEKVLESIGGSAPTSHHGFLNAISPNVRNHVIGNLKVAIDAASQKAEQLGYRVKSNQPTELEGDVEQVAKDLFAMTLGDRDGQYDCLISGGEPTVNIRPGIQSGKGGRNQHLALSFLNLLSNNGKFSGLSEISQYFLMMSAGTDGEDGPTDAAGAWIDNSTLVNAKGLDVNLADYLDRFDSYHFFDKVGGLLRSGPTGTNVCDLRLVLVGKK